MWYRAKNYVGVYGLIFICASCQCFNVCVLTVVSWRLCLHKLFFSTLCNLFPFGHVHGFISMQTLCLIKFCQKELSIYFSSTHSHTLSLWLLDIQCAKIQFFYCIIDFSLCVFCLNMNVLNECLRIHGNKCSSSLCSANINISLRVLF